MLEQDNNKVHYHSQTTTSSVLSSRIRFEGTLDQEARFISCCPTSNLLAVVTTKESVNAYRFDGQRAFSVKRKTSTAVIENICWRPDGERLAIAWSNGIIDIVATRTGKIIQGSATEVSFKSNGNAIRTDHDDPDIESGVCLGWDLTFVNLIDTQSKLRSALSDHGGFDEDVDYESAYSGTQPYSEQRQDLRGPMIEEHAELNEETLQRLISSLGDPATQLYDSRHPDFHASLPEQLATLNIENFLPRLRVPPVTTGISDAFTTQNSIDSIFYTDASNYRNVSSLIVCSQNGKVRPIMYESILTSGVALPKPSTSDSKSEVLKVSSNSRNDVSTLLVRLLPGKKNAAAMYGIISLELGLLNRRGSQIHMIASRASQLRNLYDYISDVTTSLGKYYNETQYLSRLLSPIIDDFEKDGCSPVEAFHQLAATGDCVGSLRAWLVDALTERGHQRMEIMIEPGYSELIKCIHENLLPAIERSTVIAISLRGLANYHQTTPGSTVNEHSFTRVLAVLSSLRQIFHCILVHAARERSQFMAFSKWLRLRIDIMVSTKTIDHLVERSDAIDYAEVFDFIEGPMEKTKLAFFLAPSSGNAETLSANPVEASLRTEEELLEELSPKLEEIEISTESAKQSVVPPVMYLGLLQRCVADALANISRWQEDTIRLSTPIVLEEVSGEPMPTLQADMRSLAKGGNVPIVTYVTLASREETSSVNLYQILPEDEQLTIVNLKLPLGIIHDIKWLDDRFTMLLWTPLKEDGAQTGASHLVILPYTELCAGAQPKQDGFPPSQGHTSAGRDLHPWREVQKQARLQQSFEEEQVLEKYVVYTFAAKDRFQPRRLATLNLPNHQVVWVLDEDGKHYKILQLGQGRDAEYGSIDANDAADSMMNE
ncbi:MAG: hypothetical protein M1820_003548 [Bogoriella megaspora]|nr:MAG: hypothetical protein M1820_003548 [Bogoriella megaspora]